MLVLDEVLGLELSNFSRQLKLKLGIDDDHRVKVAMSNDLWFRRMDIKEEGERRKNSKDTRAHLEAMVLRTKPVANQWLHLTPRVAALGADAFEQGPVMIRKIHAYIVEEVNLAENAEEKAAEFVNRVCQVTLETFWTQKVKGEEGFERTDSMLEGLGAGWTESSLNRKPLLADVHFPRLSTSRTPLRVCMLGFEVIPRSRSLRGFHFPQHLGQPPGS